MAKHVAVTNRSLVVKLAPPQSSRAEPVSAHWSQERKAQPSARAARGYMHSIAKLHAGIFEERRAPREQCLAERRWALVQALQWAANEPQQSAQARAQQALISTRVASVITDVTNKSQTV
jgi:hypothetical protein